MKIKIICVGKIKEKYIISGISEYSKRLSKYCNLDIIEIDAASNNGVDDIRTLREKAQVAPVFAPKKIRF